MIKNHHWQEHQNNNRLDLILDGNDINFRSLDSFQRSEIEQRETIKRLQSLLQDIVELSHCIHFEKLQSPDIA